MSKKEYIEKAKNLIVAKVRFQAPQLYDDEIDFAVLKENAIDEKLPIFKFEKELSTPLAKAFLLAQKEEKFNLLISSNVSKKVLNLLKNLQNLTFLSEFSSKRLIETVNKLNINYSSSSNFNPKLKDKFFAVGNQRLNPSYSDFSLRQNVQIGDIFVEYSEFVLNGQNIFAKFFNRSNSEQKVTAELNIPLPVGYYFFKRQERAFLIENLLTRQRRFFNFLCGAAKFSFSCVDGLENSTYCSINLHFSFSLKPKQCKFVFFNFGEDKFILKNLAEIERFKSEATRAAKDIFDVQVLTKNEKFDNFFNRVLPQKIWLNWLDGRVDEGLEQKYLTYRNLFVRGKDKITFVKFSQIGVKQIGIFNGEYYKKILLVCGGQQFLKVGRTMFYNICDITRRTLCQREPVCLCWGE
jgi:hypothetical protein